MSLAIRQQRTLNHERKETDKVCLMTVQRYCLEEVYRPRYRSVEPRMSLEAYQRWEDWGERPRKPIQWAFTRESTGRKKLRRKQSPDFSIKSSTQSIQLSINQHMYVRKFTKSRKEPPEKVGRNKAWDLKKRNKLSPNSCFALSCFAFESFSFFFLILFFYFYFFSLFYFIF